MDLTNQVKEKYHQLLSKGKEAIEALQIPFKVRAARKDMEKEIISLEQLIANTELEIEKLKGADPIVLKKILDAMDKLDLTKRDLKIANELLIELF